jgi:hypothetical protein
MLFVMVMERIKSRFPQFIFYGCNVSKSNGGSIVRLTSFWQKANNLMKPLILAGVILGDR